MDYACPVFYYTLPKYLQDELERIQRRAMAIIFPNINYSEALDKASLPKVREATFLVQKLV